MVATPSVFSAFAFALVACSLSSVQASEPLTTPNVTTSMPTQTPTKPVAVSGGQCGSDNDGVQPCPSGEYCQPWNPWYYQCRPAPALCATQQVGVDFAGDDLETIESILPSECCDRCANKTGCAAYTFVNYNANGKSACYLKSGTGKPQPKVGAVSATVVAGSKQGKCGGSTTFQSGIDFFGNDLSSFRINILDFNHWVPPNETCCWKCERTSGCKAFTIVEASSTRYMCYLKTSGTNRTPRSDATSGVLI